MTTSMAVGLAVAIFLFAVYMLVLSKRSADGRMGRNGPGIRLAETTKCEHTWLVAQQVAAPIYRIIGACLAATAIATLAIATVNGTVAFVVALVLGFGIEIFFLGAASVRARKAAEAVRCEHRRPVTASRATPHRATSPAHRRKKKRR
jgi:SdpI/YfhL protein family